MLKPRIHVVYLKSLDKTSSSADTVVLAHCTHTHTGSSKCRQVTIGKLNCASNHLDLIKIIIVYSIALVLILASFNQLQLNKYGIKNTVIVRVARSKYCNCA